MFHTYRLKDQKGKKDMVWICIKKSESHKTEPSYILNHKRQPSDVRYLSRNICDGEKQKETCTRQQISTGAEQS